MVIHLLCHQIWRHFRAPPLSPNATRPLTPPPPRWHHQFSGPRSYPAKSGVCILGRCKQTSKAAYISCSKIKIIKIRKKMKASYIFSSFLKFSCAYSFRNNYRFVDYFSFFIYFRLHLIFATSVILAVELEGEINWSPIMHTISAYAWLPNKYFEDKK